MKNKIFFLALLLGANFSYAQKSNQTNPDIGINAMFDVVESQRDKTSNKMSLSEIEILMSGNIDTNFSANILLAIEQEAGEYIIEPEEVYVETINLPAISLRMGKYKLPFGKHNILHAHAFPYINAPLINESILGEEGLNETGLGLNWLSPLSWFSELQIHYVQGENEDLFNATSKNSRAGLLKWKNLWDIDQSSTFEFGISHAQGKNSVDKNTSLQGLDLTYKWASLKSHYKFEWATEYMARNKKTVSTDDKLTGVASSMRLRFKPRWWAQYRYDYLGLNEDRTSEAKLRHSLAIAFLPSEFSRIRLQYENTNDNLDEDEKTLLLQLNISMGAHPAHEY